MRINKTSVFTIILILNILLNSRPIAAQFSLDFETGVIKTGYNDVRIPGDEGTLISFSDDLNSISDIFYRIRGEYKIGERSEVLVLIAPLKQTYKGFVNRDIIFQGETFVTGSQLNATYKFNSYRASYRYKILNKEKLDIALGLTIKIRDALIGIEGDFDKYSEKKDFGFVPLIGFRVNWQPDERFGLLLDGDALAAPQGRAEDVLLALTYKASEKLTIKAGYRILEGGADNDVVYTFSMFHYAVVGVNIKLE